jgi:hypothetical protein
MVRDSAGMILCVARLAKGKEEVSLNPLKVTTKQPNSLRLFSPPKRVDPLGGQTKNAGEACSDQNWTRFGEETAFPGSRASDTKEVVKLFQIIAHLLCIFTSWAFIQPNVWVLSFWMKCPIQKETYAPIPSCSCWLAGLASLGFV